jgi:hypothetical protein
MKSLPRQLAVAFAFSTLFLGGITPASAGLINGGFETPIVTDSGPPAGLGFDYVSGGALTGWLITGPKEVLFNTKYNPVAGGNQALQLESLSPILQTFATTPGQLYQLFFDLAAYDLNKLAPQVAPLEVIVDGVTGHFIGSNLAYAPFSLLFTASGSSTTLSFRNEGTFGGNFPEVDNASVAEVVRTVSEPHPFWLLSIGLIGTMVVTRRERRKLALAAA